MAGAKTGSAQTPAAARSAEAVALALQTLPAFYTDRDLLDALGSRDALVEAYVREWLPPTAVRQLEDRPERLLCWLLARLAAQTLP